MREHIATNSDAERICRKKGATKCSKRLQQNTKKVATFLKKLQQERGLKMSCKFDKAAFIDYQKTLAENPLDAKRQEIIEFAFEMINKAFIAGKRQQPRPWPASMDDIIQFFVERGETKFLTYLPIREYFSRLIYWIDDAYEAGISENNNEVILCQ